MKPTIINNEYVEFKISGMDIKELTEANEWMNKYCRKNNLIITETEGNNDIPYVRYHLEADKYVKFIDLQVGDFFRFKDCESLYKKIEEHKYVNLSSKSNGYVKDIDREKVELFKES